MKILSNKSNVTILEILLSAVDFTTEIKVSVFFIQ